MTEPTILVKNNKKRKTVSKKDPNTNSLYVVGIGASAGGLDALREFIQQLDYDDRVCYVILQHLSPNHESLLTTLLEKESRLHLVELQQSTVPGPGMIYVTPPNYHVEISNNVLKLISSAEQDRPKPSINRFFTTLADNSGDRAIGIILSGTGADGTIGLINIKSKGGISLVQEPRTAKYDSMPTSAIRSNAADTILAPANMARAIIGYINSGLLLSSEKDSGKTTSEYSEVIELIRKTTGYDLSQYKKRTIQRRIDRRMALQHLSTLKDYLLFLRENSEEVHTLSLDILICVTEFFRDQDAFNALGNIIEERVRTLPLNAEFRVWVPACATGEEPYSLAILFEEAKRKLDRQCRYQIFATDIDSRATTYGRQGRYPESALKNMNNDLIYRYFNKVGSEYVASKLIRESIIFSVHNVIEDPPFSRVDLITCRNLLIYFTPPLQQRVIETFYYALQQKGNLLLGKAEVVAQTAELFRVVDKQCKIYEKVGSLAVSRPFFAKHGLRLKKTDQTPSIKNEFVIDPVGTRLRRSLVIEYAPPSVVVSENDDVLHVLGDVTPFLSIQSGPTGLKIYDLVFELFRAELRALVYKCRREIKKVVGGKHRMDIFGETHLVQVTVRPMDNEADRLMVISFEHEAIRDDSQLNVNVIDIEHVDNPLFLELEHELTTTREHLQTVVEELETSNEELQSVNEELQSANEELQSTNEELQTSNEELQSTNEELLTVNDELQSKTFELTELAIDLENIQQSINFPFIVLDNKYRLKRFGPTIDTIIDSGDMLIGDSIFSLPWRTEIKGLRQLISAVVENEKPITKTIQIGERYFQLMISAYRRKDKTIGGTILMFPEFSDLVRAKQRVESQERLLKNLVDSMADATITFSDDGRILTFSKVAEKIFGYSSDKMVGKNITMLLSRNQTSPITVNVWLPKRSAEEEKDNFRQTLVGQRLDGSEFFMELSVNEMESEKGIAFIALIRDVTDKLKAEKALEKEKEKAEVTLHSIADAVISTDTKGVIEYMNPIAETISGWTLNDALGQPVNRVFKIIDESTRELITNPILNALDKGKQIKSKNEVVLHNADNVEYAIEFSAAPIKVNSDNIIGAVLVFHDVTDKRELMRNMAWQARHDSLTGLVNRQEMERRIERAITSAKSFQRTHALLYIDLDQFKVVNDTSGHQAGDELLRQISAIIGANLRNRDAFARLGGDEFGVLLENCSVSQAQHIAENIKQVVMEYRFKWEDKIFKIGASIGVVAIDFNSNNLAEILQNADSACYAAKEQGRNRVQLHSHEDHELVRRRHEMQWVGNINQSLDEGRFELVFQRISSLNDNRDPYWEALLRMYDQNKNLVLPGVFLPAAERYGLMSNIDRWVLRSSFTAFSEHLKYRNKNNSSAAQIGINISGTSISEDSFEHFVTEQFNNFGINPEHICFEITETAAIANFTKARNFIAKMRKLGCRFALDDFGSGMSSFGYLRSLPVDFIKIDGAFVKNIGHDSVDFAMVESINRVGHIMDIQTIAEFAENDTIIEKLNTIGVDFVQGFGVQKPISSAEFIHGT